jgi:hypothetical protein
MILVDMPTQSVTHSHSDQYMFQLNDNCIDETVSHVKKHIIFNGTITFSLRC